MQTEGAMESISSKNEEYDVSAPLHLSGCTNTRWLFSREIDLTVFLGSAFAALLLLVVGQAEIEAEHWLKCFCIALLKLIHARWINRSESCSNLFHVRVLAPDGERQHFDEHLSNRFVPLIG